MRSLIALVACLVASPAFGSDSEDAVAWEKYMAAKAYEAVMNAHGIFCESREDQGICLVFTAKNEEDLRIIVETKLQAPSATPNIPLGQVAMH